MGFNLLSTRLKNLYPKYDLQNAISGLSNPHHHAFEIFNGRRLENGVYEFQIFFYDHYTGEQVEFDKGKSEPLRITKGQDGKWYIDSLPKNVSMYLE